MHKGDRTKNVAVIGRERSLRFPEMTPSLLAHELPPSIFQSGAKLTTKHKEQIKMKMIKNFLRDESGMETLEYAVIAGLIAAVAIVVYASGWGTALSTRLNRATTTG